MKTLTKFRRPQIADTKVITQFPGKFKAKDEAGRPLTDEHGIIDDKTRTVKVRLKFHLGKLYLEHETGSITTLTHTVRTEQLADGVVKHWNKVTWKNQQGFTREFFHPDNLGEFLVSRYGIRLTTLILQAISQLEQDGNGA